MLSLKSLVTSGHSKTCCSINHCDRVSLGSFLAQSSTEDKTPKRAIVFSFAKTIQNKSKKHTSEL